MEKSSDVQYEFYKENKKDKIWRVEEYEVDENGVAEPTIGLLLFSFDKEKIYNLWEDYPWKFTPEEKEIFDKENPYWAEFFKDRS